MYAIRSYYAFRPKEGVVFFGGPNQKSQVHVSQKNKQVKKIIMNTQPHEDEVFMHVARVNRKTR